MEKNLSPRTPVFFFTVLAVIVMSQGTGSGVVSEAVRRPDQLITPEYPRDLSIGELGPGTADPSAYVFARRILGEVQQGKTDSALVVPLPAVERKEFFERVAEVTPRKVRVGGGREEELDGSTSFVFRFIGREKELTGELYIRAGEDGEWHVEDVYPEEPLDLNEARENNEHPYAWTRYDPFW
ncbi:MAG: hypothetical protein LBD22_01975 [Spirochaetaceae bacterium]|jgi:hypothetical protein|nr:hypothetical protein [Spirochaetaceae bacterium]